MLINVDAETTRRRFDRERRAMGRLSQAAGIAPLYGSGFTPQGQPYLLMPFYERGSLQDWLEGDGALSPDQVQRIGVTICKAVHTAHENGVLHRDIKPANILMTRTGRADVADFGIAHLVDDTLGTSQALTMTPLYTAPEIFDGIDAGSGGDVYSLGATLYALLAGRPAFSDPGGGASMLSLMRRINEDPLPELPESVPPALAAAVVKAMSKDASQRQASAGELAAELASADLHARAKRTRRTSRNKGSKSTRATRGTRAAPTTNLAHGTQTSQAAPANQATPANAVSPARYVGQAAPAHLPAAAKSKKPVVLAAAAIVVLIIAVGAAVLASTMLGADRDETVDDPAPVPTAQVVGNAGPTPLALPTPTAEVATVTFDTAAARTAAERALVRVEAFSCTGAEVSTGVVLNDGIVVTSEAVLSSPWHIDVTIDGETRGATPQTSDRNRELSLIVVDDPSIFDPLDGIIVAAGDQVAIVGIDGTLTRAVVSTSSSKPDYLVAEVLVEEQAAAVRAGDVVVTDTGGLVGIAALTGTAIDILTPQRIETGWNQIPPSYRCARLTRDLTAADAESSVSPAIGELLTMQYLSDAYANESWDLVRRIEPAKIDLSDERLINGWRPLRQGFVFPVNRELDDDGLARWRIGLIGHETWAGNDLTTLFCVTWTVDPVSGDVVQTNEDNVTVYGSQAGQPQRPGFVDPADLRVLITQNCPLT